MKTTSTMKTTNTKWTHFMDMHSGGGRKEGSYEDIYIQADEHEAKLIFYNRFGHSADRISCTCCGEDYSVYTSDSLEEATSHSRQRTGKKLTPLEDYINEEHVLVIFENDIKEHEREGAIPKKGWVYID